jgi:hypothetical protein
MKKSIASGGIIQIGGLMRNYSSLKFICTSANMRNYLMPNFNVPLVANK